MASACRNRSSNTARGSNLTISARVKSAKAMPGSRSMGLASLKTKILPLWKGELEVGYKPFLTYPFKGEGLLNRPLREGEQHSQT